MYFNKFFRNILTTYEDPNEPPVGDPPVGDPPVGDPPSNPPPKTKQNRTYSEDEFKKAMAAERARSQATIKKHLEDLTELRNRSSTTEQEKEALSTKITELENQLLSKEEIANKEKAKLEKKLTTELEEAKSQTGVWKNRFERSLLRRALVDAAHKHEAHNPEDFIPLLEGVTKVSQVIDESGKPTDDFEVKVQHIITGEDGQPKTLLLTPVEAVKMMKEDVNRWGYLFKGAVTPGAGLTNGQGGGINIGAIKTVEDWLKVRSQVLK